MNGDKEPQEQPLLTTAGATHIGQRNHNEDAWLVAGELALLADGVGGRQAGEVASALVCEVIAREVDAGATLEAAIRHADRELVSAVEQGIGRPGMATTIVAAWCHGAEFELAWVGDSRAYLWDGQLHLLTGDHSYVHELWARGELSLEEAVNHPRKHVILQAIGKHSAGGPQVDSNRGRLAAGDLLLLCSDGLSDVVDSPELAAIIAAGTGAEGAGGRESARQLQAVVDALVAAAVDAGGSDNITAVVIAGRDGVVDGASEVKQRVWSFDPVSGEYSGLPERVVAAPLLGAGTGPIAPRKAASAEWEETVDAADSNAKPSPKRHAVNARGWRFAYWAVLAGVIIVVLLFTLGFGAGD